MVKECIWQLEELKRRAEKWDAFTKHTRIAMLKSGLYRGEECEFVSEESPSSFIVQTIRTRQIIKIDRSEEYSYGVNMEDRDRTGFYLLQL